MPLVNGPLFNSHVKRLSDELPVARTVGGTVGRLVGGRVGTGVGRRVGLTVGSAVGVTVGVCVKIGDIGVLMGWSVVAGSAVGFMVGFAVGPIVETVKD